MIIAIGIVHYSLSPNPIIKLELFPASRLDKRDLINELLKLTRVSKGTIIPWEESDAYPTETWMFPISICCFLKFKSIKDMDEFEDQADRYKFFEN